MEENRNIVQRILQPSARGRLWQIFAFIIIITVLGAFIDFGAYYNKGTDWIKAKTNNVVELPKTKEIPFKLGLDLKGGSHLVYEADVSEVEPERKESAVDGVRDVIERRVNAFGVSEPDIRKIKTTDGDYRIVAELAGIKDVDKAIEMIGKTPLLEFKEKTNTQRELSEEERKELKEFNQKSEEKAEEVLGKVLSGGDFDSLMQEYDEKRPEEEQRKTDAQWIDNTEFPELANSIRDMNPGEVGSDLIETSKGFSIIKLQEERVKTNPLTGEEEKQVNAGHLLICYNEAENCGNDLSKEEAYEKIKKLKDKATPENFEELAKENSTEPGAAQTGGDLGWFGKGDMVAPFEDTVFNQETGTISYIVETKFGYHLIHKKEERAIKEYKIKEIFFNKKQERDIIGPQQQEWERTQLTGKYLDKSSVQFTRNSVPQVALQFNNEGAELFEQITQRNTGEQVAIFLDGELISAPKVNEKITGGKAVITGDFTMDEAKELSQRLNTGALPVPIELVTQKTVGASLGQESVGNSLKAGILGLILVAIFMLLVYRLPGFLAVISLVIYGILVMAIFKLWSITLTLSGIAGFILSVGMAVDANVLIFERFKEELRAGKDIPRATEEGFKRAWTSIRDGNFSTLITCFVLIQFTTSVVRGFAITLALGILVSMFSAIVITKNFLILIPNSWLEKKPWLLGRIKPKQKNSD